MPSATSLILVCMNSSIRPRGRGSIRQRLRPDGPFQPRFILHVSADALTFAASHCILEQTDDFWRVKSTKQFNPSRESCANERPLPRLFERICDAEGILHQLIPHSNWKA